MIDLEASSDGVIKVRVKGTLEESDFEKLGAKADELINAKGSAKLLIDATRFEGWKDTHAAGKHFTFVRDHQKKIERVALIAGAHWQHWIAGIAGVFVHPEIKVFHYGEEIEAEGWLRMKRAA